jgi:hypothetical protein
MNEDDNAEGCVCVGGVPVLECEQVAEEGMGGSQQGGVLQEGGGGVACSGTQNRNDTPAAVGQGKAEQRIWRKREEGDRSDECLRLGGGGTAVC